MSFKVMPSACLATRLARERPLCFCTVTFQRRGSSHGIARVITNISFEPRAEGWSLGILVYILVIVILVATCCACNHHQSSMLQCVAVIIRASRTSHNPGLPTFCVHYNTFFVYYNTFCVHYNTFFVHYNTFFVYYSTVLHSLDLGRLFR